MMPGRELVLVVDDEPQACALVQRILAPHGFLCSCASDAAEARRLLGSIAFPLVLCDVRMPGESGLDLMRAISLASPDAAIVMVSADDDPLIASIAIDRGAYGYLVKPYTPNELRITVQNALHRRRLEMETRNHRSELQVQVAQRTGDLRDALDEVERSRQEIVRRLARVVETRDLGTGGHIGRIGDLSASVAEAQGLPAHRVELIRVASPMHDVGKIGIPDQILLKPGSYTTRERREMQRHADLGHEMLRGSGIELLDLAATIAHTHHERYDGTGYPRGLKGREIPLEGRIVAVADVYDALSSDRVYRPALPQEQVIEMLQEGAGTHFDPESVEILVDRIEAGPPRAQPPAP